MVNMEIKGAKQAESPLIEAARSGDLKALQKLLDKGANVFEAGHISGGTALHYACDNG
jgi:ankyrin repeat protein